MLDYLKALGGNIRRLPITPAAILQEPGEKLFDLRRVGLLMFG
jgi:hypothetical protein